MSKEDGFIDFIIGVDAWHKVFIIKHPDIDDYLLESENAEEIIGYYDMPDKEPGVYKVSGFMKQLPATYYEPDNRVGEGSDYEFYTTSITKY